MSIKFYAGGKFVINVTDFSGDLNVYNDRIAIKDNQTPDAKNYQTLPGGAIMKRFGYDIVSKLESGGGVRGLCNYEREGEISEKYLVIFCNGKAYYVKPDNIKAWQEAYNCYTDDESVRINTGAIDNMIVFGNGISKVKKFGEFIKKEETGSQTNALATTFDETTTEKCLLDTSNTIKLYKIDVLVHTKGTGDWTLTLHDSSDNIIKEVTIANADLAESNDYQGFELEVVIDPSETYHFHLTSTIDDAIVHCTTQDSLEDINHKQYIIGIDDLGGDPKKGSIFATHNVFLCMAGVKESPRTMFYCEPGNAEQWIGGNSGFITIQDGKKINGLESHENGLVAFDEKEKIGLNLVFDSSELATGFAQKEIKDQSDGCVASNSIVTSDQGFMFLGKKGFQKYGSLEGYPDMRRPSRMSFYQRKLIDRINWKEVHKSCAIDFDDKYFCAVPFDSSKYNNLIFLYDLIDSSWRVWDGIPASSFAIFPDENGKDRLYFGHETKPHLCRMNNEFIDNSGIGNQRAIDFYWTSKTWLPSPRNRFGGWEEEEDIEICGSTTIPGKSVFELWVDDKKQEIPIDSDDENILLYDRDNNLIGDSLVGQSDIGSSIYDGSGIPKMYKFILRAQINSELNEGAEIFFKIRNSNKNESPKINSVTIRGRVLNHA